MVPIKKIDTSKIRNIVPTNVYCSRGISSIRYTNESDMLIVLIAPSPNMTAIRNSIFTTKRSAVKRPALMIWPATRTRFLPWRSEILGIHRRVLIHPRKKAEPIKAILSFDSQRRSSCTNQLSRDLSDDQSICGF